VDPATNLVYVGNYTTKDLTVVDGATNTVLGAQPLNAQPLSIGFRPDENRIYISSDDGHGVLVFGPASTAQSPRHIISSEPGMRAWDAAEGAAPADWAQVGFDDSAWAETIPSPCPSDFWRPAHATADWLWHPRCTRDGQTILLRKEFTLESPGYSGILRVHADDKAEVYLNGIRIGSIESWKHEYLFDLEPHLQAGENVLALSVLNEGGGAGVLFQAEFVMGEDK
jgi:hypothetical protein